MNSAILPASKLIKQSKNYSYVHIYVTNCSYYDFERACLGNFSRQLTAFKRIKTILDIAACTRWVQEKKKRDPLMDLPCHQCQKYS